MPAVALAEAVKRVALVAERGSSVRLSFGNGKVTIEAGTEGQARARETVPAEFSGQETAIGSLPAASPHGWPQRGPDRGHRNLTSDGETRNGSHPDVRAGGRRGAYPVAVHQPDQAGLCRLLAAPGPVTNRLRITVTWWSRCVSWPAFISSRRLTSARALSRRSGGPRHRRSPRNRYRSPRGPGNAGTGLRRRAATSRP